jgi:hypothetical protein
MLDLPMDLVILTNQERIIVFASGKKPSIRSIAEEDINP